MYIKNEKMSMNSQLLEMNEGNNLKTHELENVPSDHCYVIKVVRI